MYDIIVIGAGSGGLNIAGFMNKAGFKVLLIDKTDRSIGGDCLNYGCVPSKALIHVSRIVYDAQLSHRFGLKSKGRVDLKKVMDYVREKQEFIRKHENAYHFKNQGMDVVLGSASFAGIDSVDVNGTVYRGKKIVIATGSRPRKLNIPGMNKVKYLTNETIFSMDNLPKRLLVIGGGPIGIELGQAFQRLGCKVTVIQKGPMFLPKEVPEIAEVLHKKLKDEGMNILFNCMPKEFVSPNKMIAVDALDKEYRIGFDAVLVSIGRVLETDKLKPEKAGIKTRNNKFIVDSYLRTTNKRVYVCGDAAGSFQFTHAAELHARVIINNFFSPFKRKVSYDNLSWVTYTTPEIATFGLGEAELKKRKIKYDKLSLNLDKDDRSIVDDYNDGKLILFVSKNRILGGSMAAINAGELFQELVLANTAKLNIKNIFSKTYAYPTAARINKRIIANYFSKKLTPFARKILKIMY